MACCLAYALPSQVENKLRQAQKNGNRVVRGPSIGMSTWQNCSLTKITAPSLHLLGNPPGKRKWLKIRNKERSHTDDHYLESDDGNSLQAFPKCLVALSQMEQTKFRFLQNIKDLFPKYGNRRSIDAAVASTSYLRRFKDLSRNNHMLHNASKK